MADFDNPERYDVLREAGDDVSGTCFSPDKRRILFADQTGSLVGTRSPLKLYDLDDGTVRDLEGAPTASTSDGSLECTWSADGEGFYYAAAGGAGAEIPVYYDLESRQARSFNVMRFHGRKGRDSLLANVGSRRETESSGPFPFCFVGAQTGEVLECLENEYLRFIPWEDESRSGWKQAAYKVTYSDAVGLIAFDRSSEKGPNGLAITNLDGSLLETKQVYGWVRSIQWVDRDHILFDLSTESDLRTKVWDTEANEVRTWADPKVIDGAVGLYLPDY